MSLFLSQGNRLGGRFRCNRDVLDEAKVTALRDRFLQILAAVVASPEHPLAGELVPQELALAERQSLL